MTAARAASTIIHHHVNKGVSTMINVGFIGCGAMGRDHVRRITDKCGNAQVVGV